MANYLTGKYGFDNGLYEQELLNTLIVEMAVA